jgi:hypothetical protein
MGHNINCQLLLILLHIKLRKNIMTFIYLQDQWNTLVRVTMKYNKILEYILPTRVKYTSLIITPFLRKAVGLFCLSVFLLRWFLPTFWLTTILADSSCLVVSIFFVFSLFVEIFITYYVYKNFLLFFPTEASRTLKTDPNAANEITLMLMKMGSKPIVPVVMGGIAGLMLIDGFYAKLRPDAEGLVEMLGRNLAHPYQPWVPKSTQAPFQWVPMMPSENPGPQVQWVLVDKANPNVEWVPRVRKNASLPEVEWITPT